MIFNTLKQTLLTLKLTLYLDKRFYNSNIGGNPHKNDLIKNILLTANHDLPLAK